MCKKTQADPDIKSACDFKAGIYEMWFWILLRWILDNIFLGTNIKEMLH